MRKYLLIAALAACVHLGAEEKKVGEIVWNELATPNARVAKEFYGKVFGWEFIDKPMDEDKVSEFADKPMTYTIIKKNGAEFGGIWAIPTELQNQIPPHWLAYISVDNVNQALETARKNGATIVKPAQKVGEMGIFAIIQDPTGAHIALWQTLKK